MSSDEERLVGGHTQYDVLEPVWRSEIVTVWLRVFDCLYSRARRHGNQRGSAPRMRVTSGKRSASGKFVPGLPRNAYDDTWFDNQVHVDYAVKPGPPVQYAHDVKTIE